MKNKLSAGTKDQQQTTAESSRSASLAQNGLLAAGSLIRVQRKRVKGWKMPPNTVYVGRPGKYGNPFTIGCNASRFSIMLPSVVETVEEAIECYRYWLDLQIMINKDFVKPLKGKNLACFCKEGEKCHADVLLEVANR